MSSETETEVVSMHYVPGHGWVGVESVGQEPFLSKEVLITGAVLGGSALAAAAYFYATSSSGKNTGCRSGGLSGLHNLGKTCYANALLQGLSGIPSVVNWLEGIDTKKELEGGFVDELKDIVLKLNDSSSAGSTFNAGGVTSALAMHQWNISLGVEHDLFELLNVFVTTWDEELQLRRKRISRTSLLDVANVPSCSFAGSTEVVGGTEEDATITSAPPSPTSRRQIIFERCAEIVRLDAKLRAPCFGLTAVQLRCCQTSCGFKKVRYDPFGVLSLSIPKAVIGSVTLETLLRKYFCMEMIREATCDKCKETSGKTGGGLFKKQGFSKLPQCLIIRIERVGVLPSGQVFKHSDHVEFGETLDVRDLCFYRNKEAEYERMTTRFRGSQVDSRSPEATSRIVGGAEGQDRLAASRPDVGLGPQYGTIDGGSFVAERREAARYRYQLRAVSEHRGVPETGHFVTYRRGVKDPHGWYLTNDSNVSRVPYSQVARSQAYMLYYERIQPNRWYKDAVFSSSALLNNRSL